MGVWTDRAGPWMARDVCGNCRIPCVVDAVRHLGYQNCFMAAVPRPPPPCPASGSLSSHCPFSQLPAMGLVGAQACPFLLSSRGGVRQSCAHPVGHRPLEWCASARRSRKSRLFLCFSSGSN